MECKYVTLLCQHKAVSVLVSNVKASKNLAYFEQNTSLIKKSSVISC